ncbi:MAG: large subunit ribosomal protein [Pseudonocardiales bacterium]|jgi:large subunit ribosomal protein L31|uniref:type B 50S ribosomal protein L31 n=1 Tax=Pseudonocardia sp. TaxID=60912 RepID=UPI002624B7FF|nr:type B 50S ribosomal protein L31 [Pseudonocardia sp.]MCW2719482.1 ribosomal protein [Pseudonocardia sp.]MDT7618478.1 large subunit ribosomal protein [Pseudonocardiales bacterium]MDT7708296.1 large subunit ribosomal protein [Pseudonocardiales bacterium]
MRPAIHPTYEPVVYQDRATGDAFLTRSTATSRETIEWEDGNTYPVIKVDVTAFSHPFWTGNTRVLDAAGQVEKFRRRYGARAGR